MEARPGLTSISVTHPSHAAMKIAPRRCHLYCRGANYSNAAGADIFLKAARAAQSKFCLIPAGY
jgi:hypothetical protein